MDSLGAAVDPTSSHHSKLPLRGAAPSGFQGADVDFPLVLDLFLDLSRLLGASGSNQLE